MLSNVCILVGRCFLLLACGWFFRAGFLTLARTWFSNAALTTNQLRERYLPPLPSLPLDLWGICILITVPATAEFARAMYSVEKNSQEFLLKSEFFFCVLHVHVQSLDLTAWKSEKRLERRTRRPHR